MIYPNYSTIKVGDDIVSQLLDIILKVSHIYSLEGVAMKDYHIVEKGIY